MGTSVCEFEIPLFSDRETAFTHLKTLITPSAYAAYFVHPVDYDGLLIWGKSERERLLVRYDRRLGLIGDIEMVQGEVGAYRMRGQTYDLR